MNAGLNRRQRRRQRRTRGSGAFCVASSPGGTITFQVFDVRRHVIATYVATYVGTDDSGATETDPTGGGASPNNNMVLVTSCQYDHGQAGGEGNLTRQTQHVSDSETRVTAFVYLCPCQLASSYAPTSTIARRAAPRRDAVASRVRRA